MSILKTRCHIRALSENLELGLIGGVLASGVDTLWVVMDSYHNGISWYYATIFVGLLISTVALAMALARHHRNNFKEQLGLLFMFKKNVCKSKHRKVRHSSLKTVRTSRKIQPAPKVGSVPVDKIQRAVDSVSSEQCKGVF